MTFDLAGTLHAAIAAVCPINGVSIGNASDKTTWKISFAASATSAQQTAAQEVIANFNLTVWNAIQSAQATLNAALAAGLTITSVGIPAVNGTYALSPEQQSNLADVAVYIAVNGKFPGSQSQLALLTISGSLIQIPSTTMWQQIATVIADYVTKLNLAFQTAMSGGTPSWPSASVTIS